MATLTSIVDRVRMEIGDSGKSFVWQVSATGTDRYEVPYSPVDAVTLAVFVDGVDVSNSVDAEEHTGVITFDTAPAIGDSISVQGTYSRFFTKIPPARAAVEVKALPKGALVEIEAVAAR